MKLEEANKRFKNKVMRFDAPGFKINAMQLADSGNWVKFSGKTAKNAFVLNVNDIEYNGYRPEGSAAGALADKGRRAIIMVPSEREISEMTSKAKSRFKDMTNSLVPRLSNGSFNDTIRDMYGFSGIFNALLTPVRPDGSISKTVNGKEYYTFGKYSPTANATVWHESMESCALMARPIKAAILTETDGNGDMLCDDELGPMPDVWQDDN